MMGMMRGMMRASIQRAGTAFWTGGKIRATRVVPDVLGTFARQPITIFLYPPAHDSLLPSGVLYCFPSRVLWYRYGGSRYALVASGWQIRFDLPIPDANTSRGSHRVSYYYNPQRFYCTPTPTSNLLPTHLPSRFYADCVIAN